MLVIHLPGVTTFRFHRHPRSFRVTAEAYIGSAEITLFRLACHKCGAIHMANRVGWRSVPPNGPPPLVEFNPDDILPSD